MLSGQLFAVFLSEGKAILAHGEPPLPLHLLEGVGEDAAVEAEVVGQGLPVKGDGEGVAPLAAGLGGEVFQDARPGALHREGVDLVVFLHVLVAHEEEEVLQQGQPQLHRQPLPPQLLPGHPPHPAGALGVDRVGTGAPWGAQHLSRHQIAGQELLVEKFRPILLQLGRPHGPLQQDPQAGEGLPRLDHDAPGGELLHGTRQPLQGRARRAPEQDALLQLLQILHKTTLLRRLDKTKSDLSKQVAFLYVLNDRNRYTLKIRNFKGWGGFTAFWPYDFTIHSPQNHFLRVTKIDTHYFV